MLPISQLLIMYLWPRTPGFIKPRLTSRISPQILCYQKFLSQWPLQFLFSLSDTSPRKIFFTTQDELAVSTNTISLQWEGNNDLLLHWKSNLKVGFGSRFQEEKSLIYGLRKLKTPVGSQNWNSVSLSFHLWKLLACVLFISFSKYLLQCTISPALVLEKQEMSSVPCIKYFNLLLMKQWASWEQKSFSLSWAWCWHIVLTKCS